MNREEAIKILQEEIDGNLELSLREWQERDEQRLFPALRMAIEALSAEAEWIPCKTSGMPPEGEAVLMSDGNRIWIDETVAWWGDRSDWIGIAWMPLPTPYKGGDAE